MPNWCDNVVKFEFDSVEQRIGFVKYMEEESQFPVRDVAIRYAFKLLLCGISGVAAVDAKQLDAITFSNLPELNGERWDARITNAPTALDLAYTTLLRDYLSVPGKAVDTQCAKALIALYKSSGADRLVWGQIGRGKRKVMAQVFERVGMDFSEYRENIEQWWIRIDGKPARLRELIGQQPVVFSFAFFVSLPIQSLLNGFNGRLFRGVTSQYTEQVNGFGTKADVMPALEHCCSIVSWLLDEEEPALELSLNYHTAWAPSVEVSQAVVELGYVSSIEHEFWEFGCAYCGQAYIERNEDGSASISIDESEIKYDDDGDVVEPRWLVNMMGY